MRRPAQLATVVFLAINCILWSQSGRSIVSKNSLRLGAGTIRSRSESIECAPLSYPLDQQCAHVREACEESDTFLSIHHLQGYFCASPTSRPAVFVGLLAWLAFLFSTLGIGASDFFCPNLATIATVLGLDENVAGVTFLAVGNGSPDVFSTFSAMRTNSGSLAIGELLGAASFIVTVVVGSICIIKPFHVNPRPFLRDVGFFTVAIALLLVILHDGLIHAWEAALLVCLYITYVGTVVFATWWEKRQEKKHRRELIIRGEYEEDSPQHYFEPYTDDAPAPSLTLAIPSYSRARAFSNPDPPRSLPHVPRRSHSRSPRNLSPLQSPSTSPPMTHLPSRVSLLTALEFRDVVSSLQHQTSASSLAVFETPITPLRGGQYHRYLPRSSPSSPSLQAPRSHAHEIDPWDASLDTQLHLGPLNADTSTSAHLPSSTNSPMHPIPSISIRAPSSRTSSIDEGSIAPPGRRQRILHILKHTYHTLFPHLSNFSSRSVISALVALFATPGVLVLTITLPVVVTNQGGMQQSTFPSVDDASEGRLIDFEEDGVERVLVAEDELKEELCEAHFSKWLTAVQCALGPLFCVAMILGRDKAVIWYLVAAAVAGIAVGILVIVFSDKGNDPAARLARCFMGFTIAVVWIMAIADEVVSVLKTFGLIFGLSDAIIGLTIFAVGNSLADLVANMSVAAFAPIMGFSACFGGPMLNILLGVGVSGSYIIEKTGHEYNLRFSTTLLVSTIGLLTLLLVTMVFVPWNGFFLSRRWGIFLITSYILLMAVNVIVEVKGL